MNAARLVSFAAALLILAGCAGYQVRDASKELGGTIAGSLFHLALGGPEALNEFNELDKAEQQMAVNRTLTPEQRKLKRERRIQRLEELETWDLYEDLTSIERKYGLTIGESGVPLRMPVDSARHMGPVFPGNWSPD